MEFAEQRKMAISVLLVLRLSSQNVQALYSPKYNRFDMNSKE